MAGNRTRVNCLEGSYAHHYTTIAYDLDRWNNEAIQSMLGQKLSSKKNNLIANDVPIYRIYGRIASRCRKHSLARLPIFWYED